MTNTAPADWHGWRFGCGDLALHIGALPRRKSLYLYMERPGRITILARFTDEDSAREMQALLDAFAARINRIANLPPSQLGGLPAAALDETRRED